MSETSKTSSIAVDARTLVKRLRYELSLPVQSQFIREDVRECCRMIDRLVEALHSNQDSESA